jgi:hypothetical protein
LFSGAKMQLFEDFTKISNGNNIACPVLSQSETGHCNQLFVKSGIPSEYITRQSIPSADPKYLSGCGRNRDPDNNKPFFIV